jgi:hypothetical protein
MLAYKFRGNSVTKAIFINIFLSYSKNNCSAIIGFSPFNRVGLKCCSTIAINFSLWLRISFHVMWVYLEDANFSN